MTHPAIHLTGAAHAVAAVTALLADRPMEEVRASWTLHELPDGRVEIRGEGRASVASSWPHAVEMMLAPPAPLKDVVVRGPGRRA